MRGQIFDEIGSGSSSPSNANHSMVISVASKAEEQEQMGHTFLGHIYRFLNFYGIIVELRTALVSGLTLR